MDNIQHLLKEKNWTKQRLAKEMGITRENLYRILKGNPTLENLKKIASALEVPVWQLFIGSEKHLFGMVIYKNTKYPIKTKKDLQDLLNILDAD